MVKAISKKQILFVTGMIIFLNSAIFVTPYLFNSSYHLSRNEHSFGFTSHLSSITSRDQIFVASGYTVTAYSNGEQILWKLDVSDYVSIVNVEANPIKILGADAKGVYIFFVKDKNGASVFTLAIINSKGVLQSWELLNYPDNYQIFGYRVSLDLSGSDQVLVLHNIYVQLSKNSPIDYICMGKIFLISDQGYEIIKSGIISRQTDKVVCENTDYPSTAWLDGKLIIPFPNGSDYMYLSYSPDSKELAPFDVIGNYIRDIQSRDSRYQFLGYFILENKLLYLWGYDIDIISSTTPRDHLIQIRDRNGILYQTDLIDILPSYFNAFGNQTQKFLTFIPVSRLGSQDNIDYRLGSQLSVVGVGSNRYYFALNLRSIDFHGDIVFSFTTGLSSMLHASIHYLYNSGEKIYNLQGLDKLDNSLVFQYKLHWVAPEFRNNYLLNWTQIQVGNVPAFLEQTPLWQRYVLPSLMLLCISAVYIRLTYTRIVKSDDLYPEENGNKI